MAKRIFDESLFTHRPRKDDMPLKQPLLRVPAKGLGGLTILSHDAVGCYTHYWRGRTQPCQSDKCDACAENQQPRWRGYLFVMSGRTERVGVVELTPAVMSIVDKAFRDHRTLRGCRLELKRKGEKENGELWADVKAAPSDTSYLPKAPSLKKYLAKLWDLKVVKPDQIVTDDMLRIRAADDRLEQQNKVG